MKWSFRIARVAGIDVMVHWTFAILLLWLGASNLINGKGVFAAAMGIAFELAINLEYFLAGLCLEFVGELDASTKLRLFGEDQGSRTKVMKLHQSRIPSAEYVDWMFSQGRAK